MPRLILQFENRVMKEYVVGSSATIGRLQDNTIVIDNPAVSGHHARIFREGGRFVLEDLGSTNGTYVNEKHIKRHILESGDVLLVGKHKLTFDEAVLEDAVEPVLSELGDTVYLDTQSHRALLNKLREARAANSPAGGANSPAAADRSGDAAAPSARATSHVGVLRVLDGRADQSEYKLEAHTSLIGASAEALIRLHGWFKPKVALAIARNGDGYVATPLGGNTHVNSRELNARHLLKEGDILHVGGLTLEFRQHR